MTPPDAPIDTATSTDSPPLPTALADRNPDWESGPWVVNGVALAEDDVTQGVSGDRIHWPRETLESAVDELVGKKIVNDREHDDLESTQPAVETIVGEVTDARYEPGTGVLFEGEVDDPDIAKQIERSRVDPSPMLFRRTGEYDEERDAHTAEEIVHWRDLAMVADGASAGASVQTGAATALQAEALRSAFGEDGGAEGADTDSPDSVSDEEAESSTGADTDTDTNSTMDLTEDEEALVHAARTTDDPVVVPEQTAGLAETAAELDLTNYDDPAVVESETYEEQTGALETLSNFLTDRLAEQEDVKASEAAAMSFSAKLEQFEDEDGNIDGEALAQEPEAGGAGDEDDTPGGDGVTGDALSDEQRDEVLDLASRAETFDGIDADHAESLREQAADVAGAEEFGDIDMEAI